MLRNIIIFKQAKKENRLFHFYIGSFHVKSHTQKMDHFRLFSYLVHPMRFHNPEYQPPVTSGSRVTGCTNFVNYQKPANFNWT